MSGIKNQQILIPQKIYIGDTAEIRCTFNLPDFHAEPETADFLSQIDGETCEIAQVEFSPAGTDFYQLSVIFVPWKTGEIQLPPIFIGGLPLEFQAVHVESLAESQTALKEPVPPILLPGTAYRIYGAIIIALIFVLAAIRMIVKRKSLAFFVRTQILRLKCRRSRKITEKKLLAMLSDRTLTDKQWAERVQKIMRKYLSVKYQADFLARAASEILPAVFEITGGIQEDKNEFLGQIAEVFLRTDFVRYSSRGVLLENEKNRLTDTLLDAIEGVESA